MSKWLATHISTKVSFKITIRKSHVYIDVCWPWIWNQYFYLVIWNNDWTKIIRLPLFQFAKRLDLKNRKENVFINKLWHINLYMNIGISLCNNWSFGTNKWCFWLYFSSLLDYWSPITWNSLLHTSRCEMERCEKRAFHLLKMRKKKISWNW